MRKLFLIAFSFDKYKLRLYPYVYIFNLAPKIMKLEFFLFNKFI